MASRQFRSDDTSIWPDKFGSGADGAGSINTSTDSTANTILTGTSGGNSATAGSGTGFAANNLVIIVQFQGTGVGNWELNKISSTGSGTNWTMAYTLMNTYGTGAQVYLLKQYSSVTINSGQSLTSQSWNGSSGGIIAFLVNGALTVSSTASIVATGTGFRGGTGNRSSFLGIQGEGQNGLGGNSQSANGAGAGAGQNDTGNREGGGGGGSNVATGTAGNNSAVGGGIGGQGGQTVLGNTGLTLITSGGGGGSGYDTNSTPVVPGGNGGGIVFIIAKFVTVTGSIITNGGVGTNAAGGKSAGGGGAGGDIIIKGQTVNVGSTSTATGDAGGAAGDPNFEAAGGAGSNGRIHADYLASISGTTSPTIDTRQDPSLAVPAPFFFAY